MKKARRKKAIRKRPGLGSNAFKTADWRVKDRRVLKRDQVVWVVHTELGNPAKVYKGRVRGGKYWVYVRYRVGNSTKDIIVERFSMAGLHSNVYAVKDNAIRKAMRLNKDRIERLKNRIKKTEQSLAAALREQSRLEKMQST